MGMINKKSMATYLRIRTISKNRVSNKIAQGVVNTLILNKINSALKLHLDLI
jgi:hypothetical protein